MRSEAKVNLGLIQVHSNVIADICSAAIKDVEGVSLYRNTALEGWASFVGIRKNTGVQVVIEQGNQVSVVIRVNIRYGLNLSETSRRIQDVVMTAVEKMADINLRDVDVNIQGIERLSA